eukprot:SAG31_NODE_9819_length_1223_cov_1.400356_2_plen_170_part_01
MMSQYQEARERRRERARSSAMLVLRANLRRRDVGREQLTQIFSARDAADGRGAPGVSNESIHRRAFRQLLQDNRNFGLSREQANILIDGLADRVGLIFWNEFVEQSCPPSKQMEAEYAIPAPPQAGDCNSNDEAKARSALEDPAGLRPVVSPPERKRFRHDVNASYFNLP